MHASVDDHALLIAGMLHLPVEAETVPLAAALDRVTAGSVPSPIDLPLFRNSQMDGFAVHAADLPGTLPIAGVVPAEPGEPKALAPGTAVRIMTGAVVPAGADAIVRVEDVTVDGSTVTLPSVAPGTFVRDRGSDLREGDELVPAATLLAPRHLAALAAAGITEVPVRRRARVAAITTGSELLEPGRPAGPGQIYDANAVALAAAVQACGAELVFSARVTDDTAAMHAALEQAAGLADVIVTSGGISMGDFEVVRETLEPVGASIAHLAMQPGGPQATAVFAGVPVVCFPGNPVSTQLSFEVFLAPLLRAHAGLPAKRRDTRALTEDLISVAGKRQFLRGRRDGDAVRVSSGPGSHLVAGLAAAEVLIVVPEDVTAIAAGQHVEAWDL
ncbi:MAG: gephyrin-like molybdotransferase Glp [Aeromicrobium sp.]